MSHEQLYRYNSEWWDTEAKTQAPAHVYSVARPPGHTPPMKAAKLVDAPAEVSSIFRTESRVHTVVARRDNDKVIAVNKLMPIPGA